MKIMFMPVGEASGYHNYLDKSVKVWPEDQKKYALCLVIDIDRFLLL